MKTILVDADGVLADFTGAYLGVVESITGCRARHEDVTSYHIHQCPWFVELAAKTPGLKKHVAAIVTHERGFCLGIDALPGAAPGLESLREAGHHVICVTSPWHGPHWHHERVEWLREHMGFVPEDVVFCSKKYLVRGDVLVDDRYENVDKWPGGLGLLWDQPWNRAFKTSGAGLLAPRRVTSWAEVLRLAA